MPEKKKCIVGYKTGINEKGYIHGHVFSKLERCCETFARWFLETGNVKKTQFDDFVYQDNINGFNFVLYEQRVAVELRISSDRFSSFLFSDVTHCPFCGAEIEIKETARVTLKPKQRQVFDGYEEIFSIEK